MKNYRSYEELIKVVNNAEMLDEWDENMDRYLVCEPIRKKKQNQKEEEKAGKRYDLYNRYN